MSDYRPVGFNFLPIVVKNLLIINGLAYLAQISFGQAGEMWANNMFGLHDVRSVYFKPHQVVTYMFMHGSFGHVFFNMFAVWMFGSKLETHWGAKRFLIFYMLSGIGAAGFQLLTLYLENNQLYEVFQQYPPEAKAELIYDTYFFLNIPTIGASGAVFGCLAAYAYLFPNTYIYLYMVVPIKAKWFVLAYAGLELWMGTSGRQDGVAHWAHLGGALVGFLIVYYWNKTNRRTFY